MHLNMREFGPCGDARPPWVLLHGWGFGGSVMDPLAQALATDRRVLVVDLPGWGRSSAADRSSDPVTLAAAVLAAVPRPARWLGWSLGGLVALAAADHEPAAVAAVDLLAATPRFTADTDWPGMDPASLRAFADAVADDPAGAHRRFLAFQLAGSEGARAVLRELRSRAERDGLPETATLSAGLELLRATDLRAAAAGLSCPVRAVLGGADPLIPAAVGESLARFGIRVQVVDGAGHAPFLSHPRTVLEALTEGIA